MAAGAAPAMRTQVGIVGAGPAGLMLSHLLSLRGIESVVLESRSRDYIERRLRAGVLERGTADLLEATGVGERMRREGLVHRGIELRFLRRGHRIDFPSLTGGGNITIYGQQEVVKDLVAARLAAGGTILFDVSDVALEGIESGTPSVRFTRQGTEQVLRCDLIAGCDGSHGVCRSAIPAAKLSIFQRAYPFAWLGILAEVAPSSEELIYAHHERGFALHSMRSSSLSRLYLQVDPDEALEAWPDDRIWAELQLRLACDGWTLHEGPVVEKGITTMHSLVVEPMQHGRLYLAGDSAHIVPATGAKGLNLAIRDIVILAQAVERFYATGRGDLLDGYSAACLRRVWRAQHFSWWMTSMLHRFPGENPYQDRLQLSQLEYTVSSEAAARSLAENYIGYEWPSDPAARQVSGSPRAAAMGALAPQLAGGRLTSDQIREESMR